ncbi:MAG: glycosyltransferase family 2 protein [Breznakibacter sp.]
MRVKVSVVSINLNNAAGLKRTIESIISQNYEYLEYVVVDGVSTDGSMDVIMQYRGYIDKLLVEPDDGPFFAMNKALKLVSGEYVIFINSGDCLVDGVLKRIFGLGSVCADIVYGDCYIELNGVIDYIHKVSANPGIAFFYKGNLNHQSTFIRSELHKNFPYDESFRIAADFKLFFNLIIRQNCTVHYVNEPVAVFDISGLSNQPVYDSLHRQERQLVLSSYLSPVSMCELDEICSAMQSPLYKYITRLAPSKNVETFAAKLLSFFSKIVKYCKGASIS